MEEKHVAGHACSLPSDGRSKLLALTGSIVKPFWDASTDVLLVRCAEAAAH